MKPIQTLIHDANFLKFKSSSVKFVLTDIDDTLTNDGQLGAEAYAALWELNKNGIHVIPITGRPAGWCEMIARQWPVAGVVGENGALFFQYKNKKMQRMYSITEAERQLNTKKLNLIQTQILNEIPEAALASDQFCRMFDLAIDFCEDIEKLNQKQIERIVSIFTEHGAQAKVSSIHVNGWFGNYNKLEMTLKALKSFGIDEKTAQEICIFSGDSPNDEPMFKYFPLSVGVANVKAFKNQMSVHPKYVCAAEGGLGFVEMVQVLI